MVSYIQAAENGRAAAHETNTKFKMVTVVEHRREHVGKDQWVHDVFVGSCGHILPARYRMALRYAQAEVGRRRRCKGCPADPPKPLPADHCTYGIGGEFGERPCPTRARFVDQPGYGLLCTKHHNHLLREGYLDSPCPTYQRPPGPAQPEPPRPPPEPPQLSPPVRGHLRLVTD